MNVSNCYHFSIVTILDQFLNFDLLHYQEYQYHFQKLSFIITFQFHFNYLVDYFVIFIQFHGNFPFHRSLANHQLQQIIIFLLKQVVTHLQLNCLNQTLNVDSDKMKPKLYLLCCFIIVMQLLLKQIYFQSLWLCRTCDCLFLD